MVIAMDVVIRKGGIIELPQKILERYGLKVGEKILLKERNNYLMISPKRAISDELRGSIKANKNKIDEIVSAEIWDLNED